LGFEVRATCSLICLARPQNSKPDGGRELMYNDELTAQCGRLTQR